MRVTRCKSTFDCPFMKLTSIAGLNCFPKPSGKNLKVQKRLKHWKGPGELPN